MGRTYREEQANNDADKRPLPWAFVGDGRTSSVGQQRTTHAAALLFNSGGAGQRRCGVLRTWLEPCIPALWRNRQRVAPCCLYKLACFLYLAPLLHTPHLLPCHTRRKTSTCPTPPSQPAAHAPPSAGELSPAWSLLPVSSAHAWVHTGENSGAYMYV